LTGAAGDTVLPGTSRDLLGEPFRLDSISEVPRPKVPKVSGSNT
jgi:hypothetical protein